MSYSNWDGGRLEDDGTISGTWYIADIDHAACYEIHNQEPAGDKTLPAKAELVGKRYVVTINGKTVANLPTDWTQLPHAIKKRGPLNGEAVIKWRAYDEPQRFMVNLYLKHA
ncbi:MAG: hypothetical protein RLZZ387_2501 [Chloroflexota bacterium]|jgi:hypothetical protein